MLKKLKKGILIMIEGTDGSGKGTQTDLLMDRLVKEGYEVEKIRFPQHGKRSSALVDDYLTGEFGTTQEVGPYRASIFYAADRYVASKKMSEWLKDGKVVIADRYVGSNMGHQGGQIKNREQRLKYFAWVYDLEYNIFGIPRPDVNIILHVTPEVSQKLISKKGDQPDRQYLKNKKDILESDLGHLRDAEQAFLDINRTFPEFKLIECEENGEVLSKEEIHEKIFKIIREKIN